MCKNSEEFFKVMLIFLPSVSNQYNKSIEDNGVVLETVIIEDVLMPNIIKLLKENKDIKLIQNIFDYFEDVSNYGDKHLLNIFSITVLEVLGNDITILKVAQKYMGAKTTQLQIKVDIELGRK